MSRSHSPQICIITPTFNSESTLPACLQSVAAQSYAALEHLIIDNLSADRTVEVAEEFRRKNGRIRIISEPDEGVYDAMNKGIRSCTSEWVYFLGSDDELKPGILEQIFERPDPENLDFIYGNVWKKRAGQIYDGAFTLNKILYQNICQQAIFYRRSLFEHLGMFNLRYRIWADWDFSWRCFAARNVRKEYVPLVIAAYNDGGFSSMSDDEVFKLDAPALLVKYYGDILAPNELHDFISPRLGRMIEKRGLLKNIPLLISIGKQTNRLFFYLKTGLYWKRKAVLKQPSSRG
jgi:glycosyltransferase involved in cell wall biosynthesis